MNGYTKHQTDLHGSTGVGWWWPWRELTCIASPGQYTVTIGGQIGGDSTEERWTQNFRAVVDDFGTLRKVPA